jgi:Ca2+-transporting ATPase
LNVPVLITRYSKALEIGESSVMAHEIEPYRQSVDEVLAALNTDRNAGLNHAQVKDRRERYGRNELAAEKPVPEWRKFVGQFSDVLVILLIVAGFVSTGVWAYEEVSPLPYEAIAIFSIVLLNALMGYFQQARAERALAALKRISAAQAKVIRDGRRQTVPASELVPGDVILIEEGDSIPSDARVIESISLQTAEASLTGESLSIEKFIEPIPIEVGLGDRTNMIFSGTSVAYGHGRAVVTTIGMQTQMGLIAGMLQRTPQETTPLQVELDATGKLLAIVVAIIAIAMVTTILLVQEVRGLAALFDVLILGVALAVAAVPEGLPAVVTAVLALGVQRMARRRAIVRRLAAVETLGSATVIASDKTGTLTKNEMTVRAAITASGRVAFGGDGYSPHGEISGADGRPIDQSLRSELIRALTVAVRANNAVLLESGGRWSVQGDPTEGALIVAGQKAGLNHEELTARMPRVGEVPFSSERKLMSTIHRDAERPERLVVMTKGAADILLDRCSYEFVGDEMRPLSAERRAAILANNEKLASEALRTLGIALRYLPGASPASDATDDAERDLVFLGLIGMIDPPRSESRGAVARAKHAGIRSMMITGDHPAIARVIAAELGIADDGRVVTGAELEQMPDNLLEQTVKEASVYARVNPGDKLRIVKALQRGETVVAMTGDGVNDAPALKAADIGIAMGITGTDVSKEAADMVLADDNFATIVAAVEEGRAIFDNIRKFLRYLLSSNIGEVMTMFFGVLLADHIGLTAAGAGEVVLPLLATQILWINLVTDGAPALALGVDPASHGTMDRPPRSPGEGVITRQMWMRIFFIGTIMAVGTLLVMHASLRSRVIEGAENIGYAQTMAFTTLTLFQLFNVFNARSEERSAFEGLFGNGWLWMAVALSIALQAAVIYVPYLQKAFSTVALSGSDWLICLTVASSVLWLSEAGKLVARWQPAQARATE